MLLEEQAILLLRFLKIILQIVSLSNPAVKLTVLDINSSMLEEGKRKAESMGLTSDSILFPI